jgi:hypothetical protein
MFMVIGNRNAPQQHEQGRWPDSQYCLEASSTHNQRETGQTHYTQ